MRKLLLAATAVLALGLGQAYASTTVTTGTLTVVISPNPLALVFNPSNPTEACAVAAGTVVSALSTTGGDGNAATFAITAGDSADFAISGSNVVVGPSGISAANCGTSQNITVSASQN